jgi:hypothetical protein
VGQRDVCFRRWRHNIDPLRMFVCIGLGCVVGALLGDERFRPAATNVDPNLDQSRISESIFRFSNITVIIDYSTKLVKQHYFTRLHNTESKLSKTSQMINCNQA